MEFQLQLRYSSDGKNRLTQTTQIAGILISGDSPADWLATVTHWGLGTETLRFLVVDNLWALAVPSAGEFACTSTTLNGTERELPSAERRVYGKRSALVIGSDIPKTREEFDRVVSDKSVLSVVPLFYRCVADRLYLPVEAEFTPDVTEAELRSLLPLDMSSLFVWHPTTGLIQFEADQIPGVADLLGGPAFAETRWDAACVGETLNDVIHSLKPEVTDHLPDILQQGQGDIGKDASDISNAPPSPDEVPHPKLNDLARGMKRMIANGILGITNRLPERPGGSQSLAKLHQWASSFLSGLAAGAGGGPAGSGVADRGKQPPIHNLSSQRENELKRLLNLLKNDPDQGLRYALPLNGGLRRGQAAPSGRLGERTPDFHVGQLGGSGPADAWDLPWEYQVKLMQSYRDLAQREMRLGNHRRAAYIYGTLLGDLNGAAAALEAGELYRDAATVYQKHLNNPLKAAECLQRGGFWEEALVIYRDRGRWIEAGELLLKLEQPEEARVMFSNEIRSCTARLDFLKAGELADQRLHDPEQAVELLTKGWEKNSSAEKCFRALLVLHGQRGQHTQTRQALQKLAGGPNLFVHQRADAIKVCSDTAVTYPDAGVRDLARQQTWQIAGAVLQDTRTEQHAVALTAVQSLSKRDDLLQRDAQRFAFQAVDVKKPRKAQPQKSESQRAKGIPQPKSVVKAMIPVGMVRISPVNVPKGTKWRSGVGAGGYCCVLGEAPDESLAIVQSTQGPGEQDVLASSAFIFRTGENLPLDRCELRLSGIASRVYLQRFPATSDWNKLALEQVHGQTSFLNVLTPQSDLLLDFQQLATGITWALLIDSESHFVVEATGRNGLVCQTLVLDLEGTMLEHFQEGPYRIHHDGTRLIVFTGRHVWRIDSVEAAVVEKSSRSVVEPIQVIEFPEAALRMVTSPLNTTLRLVFTFANGAQAVWPTSNESCSFASGFDQPLMTSVGNGLFVVACRATGRIASYRLNAGASEQIASYEDAIGADPVVDLIPGLMGNEFYVLRQSGCILRLQIPVR